MTAIVKDSKRVCRLKEESIPENVTRAAQQTLASCPG
jgi:hypothetical protein